jgi:hypothetical protein
MTGANINPVKLVLIVSFPSKNKSNSLIFAVKKVAFWEFPKNHHEISQNSLLRVYNKGR